MKIFSNIPGAIKMLSCLSCFSENKAEIMAAREAEDYEKEREYILKATSSWGKLVFEKFGNNLTIHGYDNLPEKGPVVFVGNHQGYADIPTYFAAIDKFQFAFVAKKGLAKIPFYGERIRDIRSVLIERDGAKASLEAIQQGIDYINKGFSLVIFPEGTRSRGGEPHPFMRGAFKLATRPGVPIIPVSLNGTYRMFEERGYMTGADISIMIHEPIETKGMKRAEERELAERVERIIFDGVERLIEEERKGESGAASMQID